MKSIDNTCLVRDVLEDALTQAEVPRFALRTQLALANPSASDTAVTEGGWGGQPSCSGVQKKPYLRSTIPASPHSKGQVKTSEILKALQSCVRVEPATSHTLRFVLH